MDKETKIIIAGFGGQGVVLAGMVLAKACVIENKNVTQMVSYGAEMRGGTANSTVVISDEEISSPVVEKPDAAIILNQPSLDKFEDTIVPGGLVLVNTSLIDREVARKDIDVLKIEATSIADELGNLRVANIAAVGAFVTKTGILELDSVERAIRELFADKKANLIEINIESLKAGASQGSQ